MKIFMGFLPWIVFWVLSGRENFKVAAVASTAAVIFLSIRDIRKHSIKILDIGTLLFFVFLTVAAFTSDARWVDTRSSLLSNMALFLITLTSILIRKPFTLQYAREQIDPKFWDSSSFYSTNLILTWVWCIAFAVIAITSYVALNHTYMVDRVIHILAFVGAIRFTTWYPDYVKKKTKNKE